MSLNLDRSTWKRVKLGDVVFRSRTQVDSFDSYVDRYVAGGHIDTESVIIQRSGDVSDGQMGSTFRYLFKPGQVLFVSARPYLRKTGVPDFVGVVADKTYVLDATPDNGLLQGMLPFLLTSDRFVDFANQEATGSMNPRLLWSAMQRYEFDLPSLDEQRRIADFLWAIERHIEAVKFSQDRLLKMHAHARVALLTCGPQHDWKSTAVSEHAVDRWTASVPDGWSAVTISSVSRVRSGATPSRSEQTRYFDAGIIPWVKTLDLNESILTQTEENITLAAVAETSAKIIPTGSVLVAMYGGFAQIGRTARLGIDAATNQAVSAILDLRPGVLPEFLHQVLIAGRPKWRKVAASSRKDPNITKRDIENFDFPLPPIQVQREILDALALVEEAARAQTTELDALRDLGSSALCAVFGDSE